MGVAAWNVVVRPPRILGPAGTAGGSTPCPPSPATVSNVMSPNSDWWEDILAVLVLYLITVVIIWEWVGR